MKKILLGLSLLFFCKPGQAQNGLENIIVEKYYVSDANDTTLNSTGGILPVGSVTYRIYADMLPGYRFQAAFGIPGHELRIQTTTLFFNNEDRGATSPTYSKVQASHNTVMLDSWLSVGAACAGNFGVLKSEDNSAGTVMNTDGILINADPSIGVPLTLEDGMIAGTPEPVTTVGISTEIAVFDNQNDGTNGPLFTTQNGSWASLNGSIGPDTNTNKVLIAQITTDGILSFELNIQIGTPSGGVQQYVAQNPVGSEILLPSLIFNSSTTQVGNLKAEASSFEVYPNPAKDILTLKENTKNETKWNGYSIYDLFGRKLINKEFGSKSDFKIEYIDISSLASGQYFIVLSTKDQVTTKKFIKQ